MKKLTKFDAAKTMPPLRHSLPGEAFDIDRSEVVEWLCRCPQIRQYVFDVARDPRSGPAIVYDAETGSWRGVDHEA
jgi:hypothetical protein